MKKLTVAILAFVLGFTSFAQGRFGKDSAECIKYLSYYSEYVKQDNLVEAAPYWRSAMSLCPPTANQNLFINGQKILRYEISQNRKDPERCKQLIDSLLMLNDIRAQYYPKYAAKAMDAKAIDVINYMKEDKQAIFNMVGDIIERVKNGSSPAVYINYMQAAVDLYKDGKMSPDDVMNCYTRLNEYMKDGTHKDIASAKYSVEQIFINSGIASCDNLAALYAPRYEAAPTDKDNLTNMVTMLSKSECFDTDIYLKAVEGLNAVEPSAKSAYFLYKLYSSRDKNSEAAKALSNAIDQLDRSKEDEAKLYAEYTMELATFYFKKLSSGVKAVEMAKKIPELDPSQAGKAYLLIGTVWGSQKCYGNEVESRAHFWVATDYMNRAKAADPSLAADANKLIAQYMRYFPQQAEAFMYDVIDGSSYSVNCNGMHESTTVRTLK